MISSPLDNLTDVLKAKEESLPDVLTGYDRKLLATMMTLSRIQDKNGSLVGYNPNPMQLDYFANRSGADIILKGRQMGATTALQIEFAIEAMMTPGLEVLYIAQRDDSAKRLFEITTRLYHAIPPELRLPNISDSTHKLTFDFGGGRTSTIEIGTAGSKSFGRGRPVHRALFTEVAFYEGNEENTMAGIIAAMPGPDSDVPGRYCMESTANGQSGSFYEQWVAAESGASKVKPHFYGWWWDKDYRITKGPLTQYSNDEQYLMDKHNLDQAQIRWRRWQLGNYQGRSRGEEFFQQEFPESPAQAFMSIGDNVFDRTATDIAARSVTEPIHSFNNGVVQYWEKKVTGTAYHIAVDQSSGERKDAANKPTDYQVATVWKTDGLQQVATIRGRVPQSEFADMVKQMADYYNNALVIVERNMAQYGFLNMLYDRGIANFYIHIDGRAGWPNNTGTKPAAIQNFEEVCNASGCNIRSANLINEMRNYRWRKQRGQGSMGSGPGAHDDELMTGVMAFLPEATRQARTVQISRKVTAPIANSVSLW